MHKGRFNGPKESKALMIWKVQSQRAVAGRRRPPPQFQDWQMSLLIRKIGLIESLTTTDN